MSEEVLSRLGMVTTDTDTKGDPPRRLQGTPVDAACMMHGLGRVLAQVLTRPGSGPGSLVMVPPAALIASAVLYTSCSAQPCFRLALFRNCK